MKYKAIIFDVSDTLLEYSPNYACIFGDRLCSLGLDVSEEKAREILRAVNWAIGEQLRKEKSGEPHMGGEELNLLLDRAALSCVIDDNIYCGEYLKNLGNIKMPKQEMKVIHGVTDILSILKSKYRLAIVSNHYPWLMDVLSGIGLLPYFESIIISDIVGVAKPDIRIMEIALEELSLEAKDCLYVEDQPIDVLCSKDVGMDCAWIAEEGITLPEWVPYKENYKIGSVSDLIDIL